MHYQIEILKTETVWKYAYRSNNNLLLSICNSDRCYIGEISHAL